MDIRVPDNIRERPVEWIGDEKIIKYLHKKNINTLHEALARQDEIYKGYWNKIKRKVVYEVLDIKVITKDKDGNIVKEPYHGE